jgi:MFS family permease
MTIKKRHIAAVVAGNALEFYDFVTYTFFAIYIGRAFFPESLTRFGLLASLATFGAGFVMRPVGAFVIGGMGDRIGRKPAMVLSFSLMGVGIVGLALTPSYAQIGIAAPVLAVLFRLVQGFAVGGEVGPTTAFLIEAAPPHRRGFYASLQFATQDLAVLVAGLIGLGLSNAISAQALQAWGWRAALLVGVLVVPFGLVLRKHLPETLHSDGRAAATPMETPAAPQTYMRTAAIGGVILAACTACNYTIEYLTTYAIHDLMMPASIAFGATVVFGLTGIVCEPLSGLASDRWGRRLVFAGPFMLLLAVCVPCFMVLSHYRSAAALYGVTVTLGMLLNLGAPAGCVWLSESLPRRMRSGGYALVYAAAVTLFGGSSQFFIAALIQATGNPLVPAWYMLVATAWGLGAIVAASESAPVKRQSPGTAVAPVTA